MSYWYWDSGAVAVRGVEERKLSMVLVTPAQSSGRLMADASQSVTLVSRCPVVPIQLKDLVSAS